MKNVLWMALITVSLLGGCGGDKDSNGSASNPAPTPAPAAAPAPAPAPTSSDSDSPSEPVTETTEVPAAPVKPEAPAKKDSNVSESGACYVATNDSCNGYSFSGRADQVASVVKGYRDACVNGQYRNSCPAGATGGCDTGVTKGEGISIGIVLWFYNKTEEQVQLICDLTKAKFVKP